jgi:UDP-N-acetylmuramate: L-alanyl-gamma-D-glutamyl-meso-diaminopimelate ligase
MIKETDQAMRQPPPPVAWGGVHKVHLMGICGSAMGALALMLVKAGYEVRGSDRGAYPPMSTTLASHGIIIYEGYHAQNLTWAPDVVVVGNVIRPTYEEAVALRRQGISHCSLPQAVAGLFIRDRHSVVVTGTHGKTTTSSMVAWILHEAGLDPSFMIGGITGNFGANHRVSDGPTFVVEGDEYDTAYFDKGPKFLHYAPMTASINNIEFDHADIFADLAAIIRTFTRFAEIMPPDGRLMVPDCDALAREIAANSAGPVWLTGFTEEADVRGTEVDATAAGTRFKVTLPDGTVTPIDMALWGEHNVRNALMAAALAFHAGASAEAIGKALATFQLPKKRQECRGIANDVPVIDDFAHHPTAIRETLKSIRHRYQGRRIVALFEVESNTSRRRVFQDAFVEALAEADQVFLCRPHDKDDHLSASEKLDVDELVDGIRERGISAELIPKIAPLAEAVVDCVVPGRDAIVIMSGRNFHGIHDLILDGLAQASS